LSNSQREFYIICGHYGVGKSNFSINLAIERAKMGRKVILMDLDLVNPYFLSSGYEELMNGYGIRVIKPLYANSNVDIPALPADINVAFEDDADVVMDVGGDDAGSTVLGRFQERINSMEYKMIYVVNKYRNLTHTPKEAAELLGEIEQASRCHATAIVNNSHLKAETKAETIINALDFGQEVGNILNLPLLATTVPKSIYEDESNKAVLSENETKAVKWYPVDIIVKAPWE